VQAAPNPVKVTVHLSVALLMVKIYSKRVAERLRKKNKKLNI